MPYVIMEAWLSSFPMIPISLVCSFSGMNDSFMNGVGSLLLSAKYPSVQALVANIFPNITFSATCLSLLWKPGYPAFPWCVLLNCAQLSSHNSKSCFDIDHNDNYYHDPYSEMPRLSLVDKVRVIGHIQAGYTKRYEVVVAAFGGSTQC